MRLFPHCKFGDVFCIRVGLPHLTSASPISQGENMNSPEQTDDQTAVSLEQAQDNAIRLGALVREVLADQAKASSPRKHPSAHLPLMAGAVGSSPYRPTPSLDPG